MLLLSALLLSAAAGEGGEVAALEQLWSGVRDSSEQVVMSVQPPAWPQSRERRIRTVVAPVQIPWLGAHPLYLEESLEDDPPTPPRRLLLQLEPPRDAERAVHVHLLA